MNNIKTLAFATTLIFTNNISAQMTNSLRMFTPNEVSINDSEYKMREKWDTDFMMSLSPEKLLYHFYKIANIRCDSTITPYNGWEATDLKGHTLGHYITAMSLLYSHSKDKEVKRRIDTVIDELKLCQDSIGSGYLSAFPESMVTYCEDTGLGWAPYYTLHKILQGLIDVYNLTGNEKALEIADKFGDYVYNRTLRLTDKAKWVRSLDIQEIGGFPDAMLNLYALTKKEKHLKAARFFHQESKLKPAQENRDILHGPHMKRKDYLFDNYFHANGTIPQFTAAAKDYELTGNEDYFQAAKNFWTMVVNHRTYCNGTTGFHEHWNYGPDSLSQELDIKAGETCCTYNMIKLSNELFRFERNSKYADYVERALINDIMGSIQPETSNFMYFHTQKAGGFKTFGRNKDVFWCCTGSGMENHQRYAESIYFGDNENSFYVNQFIASTIEWEDKGITISQTTDFPLSESSTLKIEKGTGYFTLYIRKPMWCDGMTIKINGKKASAKAQDNGYIALTNNWKAGDIIDISLPMQLHLEPLKDNPKIAAILYGPIVLAGDLGKEGVSQDLIVTTDYFYEEVPEAYQVKMEIPKLTGKMKNLSWLKKVDGKLEFTTDATSDNSRITFRPLYQINDCRFADYWTFE